MVRKRFCFNLRPSAVSSTVTTGNPTLDVQFSMNEATSRPLDLEIPAHRSAVRAFENKWAFK